MKEGSCALVLAADESFALPLAVTLHSALTHLTVTPAIYVLDSGLSSESRAKLARVTRRVMPQSDIQWLKVPDSGLPLTDGRGSEATYARLFIPQLVPGHIERVVYLDADLLIRRDMSPLFKADLAGAPLGAVVDFSIVSAAYGTSGIDHQSHTTPYFNAGVLVFDLARWRGTVLSEAPLNYVRASLRSLPYADQDALNAVVGDWLELDPGWNLQQSLFWEAGRRPRSSFIEEMHPHRRELYAKAGVIHFTAGPRPWDRLCLLPGTYAWVWAMIQTRWLSPLDETLWLVRWIVSRSRYRIGTARRQLTSAAKQATQRASQALWPSSTDDEP